MAGLSNYDCEGTLTIGSISMNRPAWAIASDEDGDGGLWDLLYDVEQRGEDRIIPGAAGVIAYPRRVTVTEHELRLIVVGDVNENGTPNSNPAEGLAKNLAYLYSNVVAPVVSSTGTRAATLTIPGVTGTGTANIHVKRMRRSRYAIGWDGSWVGRLTISIPAGRFVFA